MGSLKLKNYDPTRATDKATFQYAAFAFDDDKIGERTVLVHPQVLDGKGPDEIRAHVQRTYEVFRRAEEYAETQDFTYADEEALKRAEQLYTSVMLIITANCWHVYASRLEEDTEEAREEQAYLDDLNEKIDINEHLAEALQKSAEVLCKQWLEDNGPEHARGLVRAADFHMTKQLAAAAIFEADEEVPPDAPDEAWHEAFDRLYREQIGKGTRWLFETYVHNEARDILETDVKPVERTLEELRMWAGIVYLTGRAEAEHGEFSDHTGVHAPNMEIRPRTPEHIWALSMMPAQTVDRAARGTRGWAFPIDDAPTFQDANNKHAVTYFADGVTLEALREGVMQLNPRTADVWRLATAAILEAWGEGEKEPPRVWIDARQLCDAMGFKKHHRGGHHPKNVAIAARALVDLERFHVTIPYGAKQYPETNGKRKQTTIQARARHRVLAIMTKEEAKQLFDDEYLPLRWLVTAGEWIKAYPREQFAPLFRALVELPGTYTPDLWAKALGTELVWQYRQDEGRVQVQRVETMLRQACVLEEARAEKNKGRARDNFEKAMDALQEYGVCTGWEYNGADIDQVEAKQKGWFGLWLQARVIVTPPAEVTKALERVAKTKKQHRRRAKKA